MATATKPEIKTFQIVHHGVEVEPRPDSALRSFVTFADVAYVPSRGEYVARAMTPHGPAYWAWDDEFHKAGAKLAGAMNWGDRLSAIEDRQGGGFGVPLSSEQKRTLSRTDSQVVAVIGMM